MALINYNSTDAELNTVIGVVDTRANLPTNAKFGDKYEILADESNSNKYTRVVRGVSSWTTYYVGD